MQLFNKTSVSFYRNVNLTKTNWRWLWQTSYFGKCIHSFGIDRVSECDHLSKNIFENDLKLCQGIDIDHFARLPRKVKLSFPNISNCAVEAEKLKRLKIVFYFWYFDIITTSASVYLSLSNIKPYEVSTTWC